MWSCCSSLLSCTRGREPLEGQVRPECDGLPAPTVRQDLRLRSSGEQLAVQELIAEAAVARFRETVLPGDRSAM